jgi:hypothetical protein
VSNDDARVDHRGRGCGRCGDASESCVGSKYTALRAYASDRKLGGEEHTPWVSGQRPGGRRL